MCVAKPSAVMGVADILPSPCQGEGRGGGQPTESSLLTQTQSRSQLAPALCRLSRLNLQFS